MQKNSEFFRKNPIRLVCGLLLCGICLGACSTKEELTVSTTAVTAPVVSTTQVTTIPRPTERPVTTLPPTPSTSPEPPLSSEADYEWNPYSNISLSVSVPLFKYSNFSAMKKTNIQIAQMMKNRDYTARQLAMQQQSYLNSMSASAEQVSSNKEAITQAQKGRDIAEKLYEVGRGTVLELNSAEVALTQARLTYAQSIYDYLTASATSVLVSFMLL